MSDSKRNPSRGSWRRLSFALALLVLLDVTFNLYFWRIPKLTSPFDDYGYQFLSDVYRLEHNRVPGSIRVLGVGSSVAVAFDAEQVQSLLRSGQPPMNADVHRLMMLGMKPSDFRTFFKAERAAIRPDVVVLLLNTNDFLNPSFERDLKSQVRVVLPPWRTLHERHANIPFSGQLDLVLAGASNLYRYRKLARSALQDHLKLAAHSLRAGGKAAPFGIYPDGYTSQRFALPAEKGGAMELSYYVDPAWLEQRGRVTLTASLGKRVVAERSESEPGWKTWPIELAPGSHKLLYVSADSAWCPRVTGVSDDVRLLGVKLREVRPEWLTQGAPPRRYPPIVDVPAYLRMGGARGDEFVARWQKVLAADDNFGSQMRFYERTKLGLAAEEFHGGGEYAALEGLVADFVSVGTKVIIVNGAESPLLLSRYADTAFYRAEIETLRSIAARYPGASFHDLGAALPADDFNDWHHVNYIGTLALGPRYAEFIRSAWMQK